MKHVALPKGIESFSQRSAQHLLHRQLRIALPFRLTCAVVSLTQFFIDWMAPKSTPDSRRKRLGQTRECS
jgi:hypothetical protein